MRQGFQERWYDVRDEVLGAALWDLTKGVGRWVWKVILGFIGGAVGGAALAAGKTAVGYIALGVSLALLLQLVIALLLVPRRRRKAATSLAPPITSETSAPLAPPALAEPTPSLEPLADRESFIQLRTYFSYCKPAMRIALNFLELGICGYQKKASGELGQAHVVIAAMMRETVLPDSKRALDLLEQALYRSNEAPTEKMFREMLGQARDLMGIRYPRLITSIKRAGRVIIGEDTTPGYGYRSADGYLLLHKYHQRLTEEVRRYRERTDWGDVVPSPAEFEDLLVKPSWRPENAAFLMSASELQRYASDGFIGEFSGKEWGVRLTLDSIAKGGDTLGVLGHVRSGCNVFAAAAPIGPDEEAQLTEGIKVDVYGSIEAVQPELITLSCARIHSWEGES